MKKIIFLIGILLLVLVSGCGIQMASVERAKINLEKLNKFCAVKDLELVGLEWLEGDIDSKERIGVGGKLGTHNLSGYMFKCLNPTSREVTEYVWW